MAQYMTYDTTVDSDIWYFEGVFKMPYGAILPFGPELKAEGPFNGMRPGH
jgi:hypothetical protein